MRPSARLAPPWKNGLFYTTPGLTVTGASPGDGAMRLHPIDIHRATFIDRLATEVTVAAAGTALRWAVYADDGYSFPGALVLDTGAVGDGTTPGVKEAIVNLRLAARRYWFGCVTQGGAATLRSFSGSTSPGAGVSLSALSSGFSAGFRTTGVSGALPSTFPPAGLPSSQAPAVWIRKA